jgi:carboxypeptidase family protein
VFRFSVIVSCLALTVLASAQGGRGSLAGTVVISWSGMPAANAPVQARHRQTGDVVRTASAADGRYSFADIPAGVYDVTVAMPCCGFDPFRAEVTVRAGEPTTFNISVVENVGGKTLADDPGKNADMIRARSRVPSLPVPRTAAGKPDFSGVWLIYRDRYPEEPAALPWAAAVAKERLAQNRKDAPHTRCLPDGFPVPGASSPWMTKFVQTSNLLVMLFEDAIGFRQVFLDGRSHPKDPNPTWLGHSIGRWEGDTLVVDTVGFNDRGWMIFVYPHTEQMHTTERYRRVEYGRLEITVVYEDPGTFMRPVTQNLIWYLAPDEELIEYVCENNRTDLLVGK